MSRLIPCPACARHVRSTERACPFCGGETPEAAAAPPLPARRATSRAALLFAGATLAAGCGKETTSGDAGPTATDDLPSIRAVPPYGAVVDPNRPPPPPASGLPAAAAGVDDGSTPVRDAGPPPKSDAGPTPIPTQRAVPPYGVSIPRNKKHNPADPLDF